MIIIYDFLSFYYIFSHLHYTSQHTKIAIHEVIQVTGIM